MAITKAPHAEVKTLTRSIVRDQQKEIAPMKAWRKAWFGNANVPMDMGSMNHGSHGSMNYVSMDHGSSGMKMTMKMDIGKLMRLKGRAFEKEFLRMMIPHHAGGIPMAQEALDTTARPQLRALAHNIIDSQAKEIGDTRAIHRRYYGSL